MLPIEFNPGECSLLRSGVFVEINLTRKCSFDLQPLIGNQLNSNLVLPSEIVSPRNPYRKSRIPSLVSSPHSLPKYPQHAQLLIKFSEDPLSTWAPRKDSYLWPFSVVGIQIPFPTYVILVTLGLPKSRGFIRLKDNNPLSQPIIDPQYFTDALDADIKAMVKGVQLIVDLYENTTALQKLDAHLPPTNLPGCENYVLRSPEYYE
ncbi:unnamed protein product [Orchesella dallaii]|uniref:Glucose-methanol-choline oxidoreductase C-terminal domain-containing protein n=1 Tax=Orchesella dallaii TaxID=48710 RepID=A0ABP1QBY4_9HEXA